MVQLSHPYMTTGKTIALTIRTFVGKVMSLLLNMLSRFVPSSDKTRHDSPVPTLQGPCSRYKITVDGDCCHEMKGHLLLGRKAMTNLYSILKSRDITLLTKVHIVKAVVFPAVMYGCESWIIKAEH